MTTRTYVDVHVLQTVPPSNLNRDDAGTPKQAVYGGVRRARVSSQAWKRATRTAFTQRLHLPEQQRGIRTKRIAALLTDKITERTGLTGDAAVRLSTTLLADLEVTPSKKVAAETSYLLFFGAHQLDAIVDLIAEQATALTELDDEALGKTLADLPVREKLTQQHPIDVALFGRMVADLPSLNVDAATQVAHALSVNGAEIEFDYFTAVDDAKPREESSGAGMIGTVEFTSATFYRYATVGVHQLAANLDGDRDATLAALSAFVEAFVYSMPTGHQSTFAHHTLPHLLTVVVRCDQPVNLVSAFEKPVRATERRGIAEQAIERLASELDTAATVWGVTSLLTASVYDPNAVAQTAAGILGAARPFPDLLAEVTQVLRPCFDEPVAP